MVSQGRRFLSHLARAPRYFGYVAWTTVRTGTRFCQQLASGQRAAWLALCESSAPKLRGLFSEYEAAFFAQVFVYDEYQVRRRHLPPGSVVVDVGAHVGFFSWRVFSLQPDVFVHAFEPEEHNATRLQTVFTALGIPGEVAPVACTDEEGQAVLHLRNSVTHSLVATHHSELDEGCTAVVPTTTVDRWLADHGQGASPIALMKIDVEGKELDVLRGATQTLQRTRSVVLETHSKSLQQGCWDILTRAGFSCRARSSWGPADSDTGLLFADRPARDVQPGNSAAAAS
jgi:FkbM family methyltransferase